MKKARGDYIHVSLYQPVDGEKQYEGFLQSFDAEQLTLKIRIKTREKGIVLTEEYCQSSLSNPILITERKQKNE